jgi:hypothetical protein
MVAVFALRKPARVQRASGGSREPPWMAVESIALLNAALLIASTFAKASADKPRSPSHLYNFLMSLGSKLITKNVRCEPSWVREKKHRMVRVYPGRHRSQRAADDHNPRRTAMNDLIFIAVVVVFFIVAALYARLCEKL